MKIIINKLDLLKKTLITHLNVRKKYLLLFGTKLTRKILNPKNSEEYYQSLV